MAVLFLIRPWQADCAKAMKLLNTLAEVFLEVNLHAGSVSKSAMPRIL